MRIRIIGNSESVAAVRSSLHLAGAERPEKRVVVSDIGFGYTVEINDDDTYPVPNIDGVDSELERRMINMICTTANTGMYLLRPGGNQSDSHIIIGIPANCNRQMVEMGIMRAIVQMFTASDVSPVVMEPKEVPWVDPPAPFITVSVPSIDPIWERIWVWIFGSR